MTTDVIADTATPLDSLWRELGAILVEQQGLLEALLYRLDQEHLILATGRTRWLSQATSEVMAVGTELGQQDERRRGAVDRLAVSLGMGAGVTLSELAERAPDGWAEVLRRHREIMRTGVADVQAIVARNRAVVAERLNSSNALLNRMGATGGASTYGPDAAVASERTTGRHVWGSM
jgi:flagellar biosynthesis/type III secretory pathway chaperone